MKFFPNTLQQFGFDPDSAELTLEKVDLPISIGNERINKAIGWTYQTNERTFLVRKINLYFRYSKILSQDALYAGDAIVAVLLNLNNNDQGSE